MKITKKKAEKIKVAVIGTYGHPLGDLRKLLPKGTTELIVGTEDSVDIWVCKYSIAYKINFLRLVPKGEDHSAALENLRKIIRSADKVLIFWDGVSDKTAEAIRECVSMKKNFNVYTTFRKS